MLANKPLTCNCVKFEIREVLETLPLVIDPTAI